MVTKEQVDVVVKGAESIAKVATGTVSNLAAEAINVFIIESSLQVLKFATVFIIFYMVKRFLDFLAESDFSKTKVRALKLSSLICAVAFFTTQSMPHLTVIVKALVAPNIFLMEKGSDYVEKLRK